MGFPGESEEEFTETISVCRRAGFSKIHIFPFSPRAGTPAAESLDQVSPEVRKDRLHRLEEVERELAADYHSSLLGRTLEVLVERTAADRPGFVRGTDRRYVPVSLPGDETDIGQLIDVRAVSSDETGILGER